MTSLDRTHLAPQTDEHDHAHCSLARTHTTESLARTRATAQSLEHCSHAAAATQAHARMHRMRHTPRGCHSPRHPRRRADCWFESCTAVRIEQFSTCSGRSRANGWCSKTPGIDPALPTAPRCCGQRNMVAVAVSRRQRAGRGQGGGQGGDEPGGDGGEGSAMAAVGEVSCDGRCGERRKGGNRRRLERRLRWRAAAATAEDSSTVDLSAQQTSRTVTYML